MKCDNGTFARNSQFVLAAFCLFLQACELQKDDRTVQYAAGSNWSFAGGTSGATKYSLLNEINKTNVQKLQVAWIFKSGKKEGNVQMNPLIVGGVMYITTYSSELIALDAATGRQLWRFNPARAGESFGGVNRGIAYSMDAFGARIFFTSGSYLNAVDGKTGVPVQSFGHQGRINLNDDLIRAPKEMKITVPGYPLIYKNIIVVPGTSWSAPANVSGFDVTTGKRLWVFNLIPHPGEFGYHTWGDTSFYRNGIGVNPWGGMALDQQSGIVYVSTGQPKDDFFRPQNKGSQLFGNCIIALNASNGKRIWHYQVIHHDLWDLDLPCAPILVDLYVGHKKVPGVVQLSKTGNVFLFNRLTGKLYSHVQEKAVPHSSLPGESVYPTQPFVAWPEPFSRQVLRESDLARKDSASYVRSLYLFKNSDTGWFVPPSEKGLLYYGIHGGVEWGGGAYDPEEDRIYVNANELAWHIVMKSVRGQSSNKTGDHPGRVVYETSGCINCHGNEKRGSGFAPALLSLGEKYTKQQIIDIVQNGRRAMPAFSFNETAVQQLAGYLVEEKTTDKRDVNSPIEAYRSAGYEKFLDAQGYPATKPPWGTLNAINLKTGKIDWKVPLGEYDELIKKQVPITGTENFGGSIVTKGGLVFIAATRDEKFRAFDKNNGKLLWQYQLPFGGYATPSTYEVNNKQYVVIAATGGGKLGTKTGDVYIAFALPQ